MPKRLLQTLQDSKLYVSLSCRCRLGSHSTSFAASDCCVMAACSICDENEPVSFEEA